MNNSASWRTVQLHDDMRVGDGHDRHSIVVEQSHGGYFPCDVKVVVGVEVASTRPRVVVEWWGFRISVAVPIV